MSTKIEWAQETWNPIIGCSMLSEGCRNCYAEKMAHRLAHIGTEGYATVTHKDGGWNGKTAFVESALEKPLRWKKPRRIFVCSMGDLFHESVYEDWLNSVFNMMGVCQWHTFIILTKRPKRMVKYITPTYAPMKNVILGVTAENQQRADERLPELIKLAKAGWKTVVSVEPMLGQVDLCWFLPRYDYRPTDGVNWVICGCESGPNRRPMDIEWARDLKNQCQEAGVAFFMKQMEINGKVCKDITQFPGDLRIREYPESEVIDE